MWAWHEKLAMGIALKATTRPNELSLGAIRAQAGVILWTAGQRRAVALACGLWDVGRMWFLFVLLKKTGFCTIEARILGQDHDRRITW